MRLSSWLASTLPGCSDLVGSSSSPTEGAAHAEEAVGTVPAVGHLMSRNFVGLCATGAALLVTQQALARPEAKSLPRHRVSLSIDFAGLILANPIVRPTIDLRLGHKWSLSMAIGLGSRAVFDANERTIGRRLAWDAAIRPRYFLLGDFDQGVHIGAATTFARVSGRMLTDQDFIEPPVGLWIGPTIGFKTTLLPLIDVDIEAGALFRLVAPSTSIDSSTVVPYGALLIGRSF